ncbi:MAG: DUF4389 domain-containing protein [Pseudomonadales bacterium]
MSEEEFDTEEIKENIKAQSTWIRLIFILIYAVVLWATSFVLALVVIFQFLTVLFTRQAQPNLLDFGDSLAEFVRQIICYMTFNQTEKPFPFGEWPGSGDD